MNIIDMIQIKQRRQAMLASQAAVSLVAPTAVAGLVVSIGDVMKNGKAVSQKRYLNSSFKKIKHAVMVANRDKTVPKIALEAEESSAMETLMQAAKSGVSTAIETLCEGLFTFIPFAIESVVIPMFSITVAAISAVLPLVFTPEGLAVVGVVASGAYLYKRWSDWKSGKYEGMNKEQTLDISLAPTSEQPEVQLPANATSSIQRNNPGNLVYAHQPGSLPESGRFAAFGTQGQGLYNMGRQLELNYSRGKDTVRSMIETWAPKSDHNDTDDYIKFVSQRMGISPDQKFDLSEQKVLETLMHAIIFRENSQDPYTAAQVAEAARQAIAFAANGYKDQVQAQADSTIRLVYPASGTVSSPFGHREKPTEGASTEHQGVDIAGTAGSPILAAADGVVEDRRSSNSYGNFIQLRHQGFLTRYGHMASFAVNKGDSVVAGQRIGTMGSTGISTGAHLHFEVQPMSATAPVDPGLYLSGLGKGTQVAGKETPVNAQLASDKTFVQAQAGILKLST